MNTTTLELDTKASLLKVSRRMFSQSGYENVSVRMICQEAGCNVSAISYHFGGKESLYRACLEAHGLSVQALTVQILRDPRSREDFEAKLRLFLDKLYSHLCENSDVIGMMVYEIRSTRPMATDIMTKYYYDIPVKMEQFLSAARDAGILNSNIHTGMVSDMMLSKAFNFIFFEVQARQLRGTCIHDQSERNRIIDQTMLIFTGGIYA